MALKYMSGLLVLTIVLGLTLGLPDPDPLADRWQKYWQQFPKEIRRELKGELVKEHGQDSHSQWEKKILDIHYSQDAYLVEGCTEIENNTKAFCGGENVTEIPQNLTRTIEYISFFQTGMEIIPDDILGNYPKLKIIHFFGNTLKEISPGAFHGLSELEYLFLMSNKLSDASFGSEIFKDLSSVKRLSLTGNEITKLPNNLLTATTSLVYLGLDSNSIDQMGLELTSPLDSLTHLYLSSNKFSSLDQNIFQYVPKLEYLYLNHNYISNIKNGALKELDNLRHFEARHMNAKLMVQDNAFNIINLRFLDLSGNSNLNISTLALMNAPALEEILLKSCNLTSLDGAAFMYKPYLKKLNIGSNPFHCDCHAVWMAEAMVESRSWALDWDVNGTTASPACESPTWMQNKAISDLYTQDLTCDKPYIDGITPTFIHRDMSTKTIFKARVKNGQPQTKWVMPDMNIHKRWRQFGSVNDTVVDSDHSVITQYELDEGFDMTGLLNFTLTASNLAGDSSLTFWVYTEPRPSNAVGRPVATVSMLPMMMLMVHYLR